MSGGSYDYLCRALDFTDLVNQMPNIERMSKTLAHLGYAADAARETEELLLILRQSEVRATVRLERLRNVWQAVEWWHSADWSQDQVKQALDEYRGSTGG
ncbi:hypothetical protein [Streptomyces sp. NRRL B-1347]|uniref:hypothetical protein n=1 Tax=Streptomyces sp. NRRL B-1347 TaxID=1476877 RepID=UPI0004CBCF1A|nr:hypothetical protein [Streptomyces sp. NRRL B-1347]